MSDRLKSTSRVENEEVIADLTKDLKLSAEENLEEFVISPGSSTEQFPSGDGPKTSLYPDLSEFEKDYNEHDKDHGDPDKEVGDSDFEEVSLKDAEVDLTDDEKEERKLIAEELKTAGNIAFKDNDFEKSIEKYTEGLKICPLAFPKQRAILFCNRGASQMKLEKYEKAIKDCTRAIELDDKYLKAYHRRAQSYEATDKLDESLADYQKVLELDPSNKAAQAAVVRLPPLVEQKNEKLKEEMLGKLKDLGNMILKPFGLSTNNFKLEQDPDSKGYKINFQQ